MKKIFLIPLLACFSCVMAWGATRTAGTFQKLQEALEAAAAGDVIELTADILDANALIDINKSITIDGKGFKLEGQGGNRVLTGLTGDKATEFYQQTLITVNNGYGVEGVTIPDGVSRIDVILKNIAIKQTYAGNSSRSSVIITTYDYVKSLTLDNCTLDMTVTAGHNIAIAVWGTETDNNSTDFNLTNSTLYCKPTSQGYPIIFMKPVNAYLENTSILGSYCNIYFKPPYSEMPAGNGYLRWKKGNSGSAGSVFTAKNSQFVSKNTAVSGASNGFATFVFEESGITLNLENCGMDAQQLGSANQNIFVFSEWAPISRFTQKVVINLSGDNTHFNGKFIRNQWYAGMATDGSFRLENGYKIQNNPTTSYDATKIFNKGNEAGTVRKDLVDINITGGTYSINPKEYKYVSHLADKYFAANDENYEANFSTALSGNTWGDADYYHDRAAIEKTYESPYIPEGYEVKTITLEGVATPLYRVVKKAAKDGSGDPLYDLNDNVETAGAGQNPVTSFELSDGSDMTLNQQVTKAGYVQVMDNGDDATTVTVGKDSGTDKDQKLIINKGLDVQGNSKVEVKVGSTLEIGEGGIVTEKPENIVIGADENGAASLIMDPTITVNQTPNLTVKMKAKQIGWETVLGTKSYFWHRFALPIQRAEEWVKNPNKSTYVFGWNYSNDSWEQLSALTQMVPFKGYTLSADYEHLGDVEYTFTGQLAGNTNNLLEFERNGFNFFGNSYTGYINVLALLDQLMGDSKIDGTVWMWGSDQNYHAVPLQALQETPGAFEAWQKEVAPMQTFILKQNGSTNATTELNYASAIWGNPRYGHSVTPAPSRNIADETTRMRIIVTAENGKSDFVMFTEGAKFSDSFEKGYDGEKYMNENALNMFATVNGANYTAIATDNLEGKMITINTVEAVNYTMSFAKVNGEEYAIRDNVTGKVIAIQEGASYEFAAQPNSTVEGRFQIVTRDQVTTAIENTEVKANVKGIYTLMGQYVGEDFNTLPAGVYVVDGVKIVK